MAAAMHFFSMSTLEGTPSTNALPSMMGKKKKHEKWSLFKALLTKLVCRYVLVENVANYLTTPQDSHQTALSNMVNPHTIRIASEHNYAQCHQNRIATEHCYYKQQQNCHSGCSAVQTKLLPHMKYRRPHLMGYLIMLLLLEL